MRDDGLVLRELLGTNNERDRENWRHGDEDTTDQEHQDVVETAAVAVAEASIQAEDLRKDESRGCSASGRWSRRPD